MGGEAGDAWACENSSLLRHLEILNRSRPHLDIFQSHCPAIRESMQDCQSCLRAPLTEAGYRNCHWSTAQSRCLSPISSDLLCQAGTCGKVLVQAGEEECPGPCSLHTQCSACLARLSCGWCNIDSLPLSGRGVCTQGTLEGPTLGECKAVSADITVTSNKSDTNQSSSSWYFTTCPLEDECSNGHHNCDPVSQDCQDQDTGYTCRCKHGYLKTWDR